MKVTDSFIVCWKDLTIYWLDFFYHCLSIKNLSFTHSPISNCVGCNMLRLEKFEVIKLTLIF